MAVDRTLFDTMFDSDGSPASGEGVDRAFIEDVVLDPVDAEIVRLEGDIAGAAARVPRVAGTTSHATPTPNADTTDLYALTAQAAAAAFGAPTGTPVNGQELLVRIKDNGTARALTWNAAYVEGGVALPSTTVLSKILTIRFLYNTDNALNKWQCVAVALEGAAAGGAGLSAGSNYINDTANTKMTIGLTINQGAADDEAIALKSSDVAHAMTNLAEADTYGSIQKGDSTTGGIQMFGYSSGTCAFKMTGRHTTDSTTKSSGAEAAYRFQGSLRSGADTTDLGANANIIAVANHGTVRFILDADGDSHQDVGTAWTNFDDHDDVAVLQTLAAHVTRPDDPLREAFGDWLLRSRASLERMELVTFNDDGHHFVNMSRLTMLLVGAARQLGSRLDRLESRLLALEA